MKTKDNITDDTCAAPSAFDDLKTFAYENIQAAVLIDGAADIALSVIVNSYTVLYTENTEHVAPFSIDGHAITRSVVGAFTTYMIRDVFREWYDHGYIGGIVGGMAKYGITRKNIYAGAFNNLGYEMFKEWALPDSFKNTAISTITVEASESVMTCLLLSPIEKINDVSPFGAALEGAGVGLVLTATIHAIYEPSVHAINSYFAEDNSLIISDYS